MIPDPGTRLGVSHRAVMQTLRKEPDLRDSTELFTMLELLAQRRTMDLSDLPPEAQSALVATRSVQVLPSMDQLTEVLGSGRRLTVKFGIDPTAADVHIGHAVPMILASRLQRMGHHVAFIVGDVTAMIGDPSGRSAERPPLTEDDIAANVASYRAQVGPFFDFDRAEFRFNSLWLSTVTVPQLLAVLAGLPVSASLQRDDFRRRLADGAGLSLGELLYSVVMALDSVHVRADVEIGGVDQLLNMQMCRRVMANAGLPPELVITTGLIEGTDGIGAKMSKSAGNYIGLAFAADDVFGKLMSVPDRLVGEYLRALTELLDPEIGVLEQLTASGAIHPMGVKTLLAAAVTATIHGQDAASVARDAFHARFTRRRFSDLAHLVTVDPDRHGQRSLAEVLARVAGAVPSLNHVRRVARAGGLRLVVEGPHAVQTTVRLADADQRLAEAVATHAGILDQPDMRVFLRCGRMVVELV